MLNGKTKHTQDFYKSKNNFFDELSGRIKLSKEQRNEFNKEFKITCNMCKCCTKEKPCEFDHITSLASGGTNKKLSSGMM